MRWYAYRLFERASDGISLRFGGRLLQQFLVNAWACMEQARLLWVMLNQAAIRSDLYSGTCIPDLLMVTHLMAYVFSTIFLIGLQDFLARSDGEAVNGGNVGR